MSAELGKAHRATEKIFALLCIVAGAGVVLNPLVFLKSICRYTFCPGCTRYPSPGMCRTGPRESYMTGNASLCGPQWSISMLSTMRLTPPSMTVRHPNPYHGAHPLMSRAEPHGVMALPPAAEESTLTSGPLG